MKISKRLSFTKKFALTVTLALGLSTSLSCLSCRADSFQFELYKNIAKTKAKSNILVSPYSAETAMTMAALGASGTTYDEMNEALDLGESKTAAAKRAQADLNSLNAKDDSSNLKIVNNLFGNKQVKFNAEYIEAMKNQFQANLTSLNFSSADSKEKINNWVKLKTDGKISSIIDRIDPAAKLYLVNAVYFKSTWGEKFDPALTAEKSFHTADEQMVKVPTMMQDRKDFSYFSTDKFQALRLQYKNGRFCMFFFLPAESSSLEEFENSLSEGNWQGWLERFNKNPGKITLPKFKIADSMKLKSPLRALGMEEAFDSPKADFSNMIDKTSKTELFLSEVFHKTFIDVGEEGTEAAAATGVEASSKSIYESRGKYFEMKLNRPFLFALHDQKTNKILFLGHIADPSKK